MSFRLGLTTYYRDYKLDGPEHVINQGRVDSEGESPIVVDEEFAHELVEESGAFGFATRADLPQAFDGEEYAMLYVDLEPLGEYIESVEVDLSLPMITTSSCQRSIFLERHPIPRDQTIAIAIATLRTFGPSQERRAIPKTARAAARAREKRRAHGAQPAQRQRIRRAARF